MRDLFDRLGGFLQLGIGAATFVLLAGFTPLHAWAAALAGVGASYVGMWLLALLVGMLSGGKE